MIKGIQAVRQADLQKVLLNALLPVLKSLLESRGAGHCMRVADLDEALMDALCLQLRQQVPDSQVYVLGGQQPHTDGIHVSSTKLVEYRNPDEQGHLRPPLLVFVPNQLKTSSEDSFGVATFEQVDVTDTYQLAASQLQAAMPAKLHGQLQEIHYLLTGQAGKVLSDYQWCRYLLLISQHDCDASILGAGLYELGLIPDFGLHQQEADVARRLASNTRMVDLIATSERSAVATVYDLQLEGENFKKRLANYLNEQGTLRTEPWVRNIVLDSNNWDLSFDKWCFRDQQDAADSVCITVTDIGLPTIPENETNPLYQPLIGQKVLTVGQGGLKNFGVSFSLDPNPQDVRGLATFKAQVFTRQGDFIGLLKVAKASKRSSVTINFNKLTGMDWQEGWHYVRVQAFDAGDELLPLVDTEGNILPWGTSHEDEVGNRPNESELFYVIPANEVDVEPVQSRLPKEESLGHARLKLQLANLQESGQLVQPEIKSLEWSEGNGRQETALTIQFKQWGGVQVSVSEILRDFERRIIADPMASLTWRLDIRLGEAESSPLPENDEWPLQDHDTFAAFAAARQAYLGRVGQGEAALISVAHDFLGSTLEAKVYADTYTRYLSAVYQFAENAHEPAYLQKLKALLRLDSLTLHIREAGGSVRQGIVLGPTHPLRVLWNTGWVQVGDAWLKQAESASRTLIPGLRNGLFNELSLINFPYVIPDDAGQLLIALDNIHAYWTLYGASQEREPQALIDTVTTALGLSTNTQQKLQSGQYLASKVERYLLKHPYIQTLTLNVFNAGRATVIRDMLLALQKKADLRHLRYEIRLFVVDPYMVEVGADLLALLDRDNEQAATDSVAFNRSNDSHLRAKLSLAVRAVDDFQQGSDKFPAHLSLLFDVFPAEEIAVITQAADERIAPVHGLYQDYCVDYRDDNGLVAWERYTRHGHAKPLYGGELTEMLSQLPQMMASMSAAIATGYFANEQVPVVRLALDAEERALLNQLHEISDWVFTIDRNLGIEFFDHDNQDNRPDYLIDHSPEMAANNGHQFVITSRSTTEIEALLGDTLAHQHIATSPQRATRILNALRALSGRLALKLVSSQTSQKEALGLALAKLYLDYQGVFHNQIIVPLDAHLELYQELSQTADEMGDAMSLKRTDLALFDFDASNKTLRCNLVEVKCYTEVGSLAAYGTLKESIAAQISQSERVLQNHFDPHRTTPDRPDRLIRTQKLCVLLEHYLKRANRFGLLEPDVFDEAKYLLRTLESGYRLTVSRSALIFDFGQNGRDVENEAGIEYHRIGRQYIDELLDAELTQEKADSEVTENSLSMANLTLPKLGDASFLAKQRDRTVSWDSIVRQAWVAPQQHTVDPLPEPEPVVANISDPTPSVTLEKVLEPTAVQEEIIPTPTIRGETAQDKTLVTVNAVPHDIVLGVTGDSAQYGLIGEVAGRKVALDLNHTHTISLFGVQGGGKSYTLGTVVEMATMSIPGISALQKELASVIFHYSATQDYKPEFTSMIAPNDDAKQLAKLKSVYGAEPQALNDVVLLTPIDKLDERQSEYPGINVYPLQFCSAELQASHWKFLMGAVGNQAAYIRQIGNIMRQSRNNLTLENIRQGIASSRLTDAMKDLANMRLDFAEQYIDDDSSISNLIQPGRMIIVDLRDEFLEKDEALGLFVVLLQLFAEAKYQGETFNKLIVFDECHKYIDSPDLVKGLVETVREMRHKGTSVMIASQDPPSVPVELIELSSQIILHKFNSPAWLKHIQKANTALDSLTPEKLANLQPGEAYIWSSKASDNAFSKEALKVQCRPRVTKHGGDTLTAIG